MIAGEPVEELLEALRQITWKKTRTGSVKVSALLDRELGEPLYRALTRIERELRTGDAVGMPRVHVRTPEQRRVDALVALVHRVAESIAET